MQFVFLEFENTCDTAGANCPYTYMESTSDGGNMLQHLSRLTYSPCHSCLAMTLQQQARSVTSFEVKSIGFGLIKIGLFAKKLMIKTHEECMVTGRWNCIAHYYTRTTVLASADKV